MVTNYVRNPFFLSADVYDAVDGFPPPNFMNGWDLVPFKANTPWLMQGRNESIMIMKNRVWSSYLVGTNEDVGWYGRSLVPQTPSLAHRRHLSREPTYCKTGLPAPDLNVCV